jgi:hypothetical protein
MVAIADAFRHTGAAACLCFGLGAFGAALAQEPPETPPPQHADVPPDRYQQQPSSERARGLLEHEGALPSPEERREELRTLNQIYRELMPESRGTVPAPGLAPEPGPRGER